MVINIAKIAKELDYINPDLITRPVGKNIYKKIHFKMKNIMENEVLVLDFDGIRVIDSSFIDELIVKLIADSWNATKMFFLKLKNISNIAEINIDSVFKSFAQYNSRSIAVMTEEICRNNSFYIGSLNEIEKDIIEYLRINKSASLNDLVYITGTKEDVLAGLIDNLFNLRLVRRNKNNIEAV